LLQERIEKAYPCSKELTVAEKKRLEKLEEMTELLKCGENVQSRQLQSWLSADEYEQIVTEWDT
jgi:hypothetical protein